MSVSRGGVSGNQVKGFSGKNQRSLSKLLFCSFPSFLKYSDEEYKSIVESLLVDTSCLKPSITVSLSNFIVNSPPFFCTFFSSSSVNEDDGFPYFCINDSARAVTFWLLSTTIENLSNEPSRKKAIATVVKPENLKILAIIRVHPFNGVIFIFFPCA